MENNYKHTGIVKFFNTGRLYGFITDDVTGEDYFCHNNGLTSNIRKGDKVIFQLGICPKGLEAINVKLIENNNLFNIRCDGNKETTE